MRSLGSSKLPQRLLPRHLYPQQPQPGAFCPSVAADGVLRSRWSAGRLAPTYLLWVARGAEPVCGLSAFLSVCLQSSGLHQQGRPHMVPTRPLPAARPSLLLQMGSSAGGQHTSCLTGCATLQRA